MRRNKKQNLSTFIIVAFIIIISITVYSIQHSSEPPNIASGESEFTVYFIDVGQGDAIFIDNGDNDILIDAGPQEASYDLIRYLDMLDISEIEYVFFTHPHEDHIGGADDVLRRYSVNNVIIPKAETNSVCYDNMREAIDLCKAELIFGSSGQKYNIGDAKVEILSPVAGDKYSNLNLYSLVMRITYKDINYIFTGDAEIHNENYLLNEYKEILDCDVLKVGHHGSSTSSCDEFITAVSPEIAVISVGKGNRYGHPHVETLVCLREHTENVYRTDRFGDIVLCTDGKSVWVEE